MKYVRGILVALGGGLLGWSLYFFVFTLSLGNAREYYAWRVGLPCGMTVALGIYYLTFRTKFVGQAVHADSFLSARRSEIEAAGTACPT
jgi:hypothetical protein